MYILNKRLYDVLTTSVVHSSNIIPHQSACKLCISYIKCQQIDPHITLTQNLGFGRKRIAHHLYNFKFNLELIICFFTKFKFVINQGKNNLLFLVSCFQKGGEGSLLFTIFSIYYFLCRGKQ